MQLETWVVYDHPADYPDGFIARCWLAGEYFDDELVATERCYVGRTLDAVRLTLAARGLVSLDRSPEDDPVIVETWL